MNHAEYMTYLHQYNLAVKRYSEENNLPPEEVVDMISIGELVIE